MINPKTLDFPKDDKHLQAMLIFCICVAGKNAITIQKGLNKIYDLYLQEDELPFSMFQRLNDLATILRENGIGCYNRKAKYIKTLVNNKINLYEKDLEYWKRFPGLGWKSITFYLLQLYPNMKVACLDTHILKFLKDKGHDVPKSTPQNFKRYKELSDLFIKYLPEDMTLQEFDLQVWTSYRS